LFHNSNLFGSCIIHVLYTGCAKIKKNNSGAKRLMRQRRSLGELGTPCYHQTIQLGLPRRETVQNVWVDFNGQFIAHVTP